MTSPIPSSMALGLSRVCGGTMLYRVSGAVMSGLSPRVRGNR